MTLRGWTRFVVALACACSAGSSGGGGGAGAAGSPAGAGGRAEPSGGVVGAGRAGAASGAPAGGAAPQPAGAGGVAGGFVFGGAPAAGSAAGAATSGGSPTSSAGAGTRCDFIEACREVATDCAAVLGSSCGMCKIGSFACGNVSGFYTDDGAVFACVPSEAGLDCSKASLDASLKCNSCRASGVGGRIGAGDGGEGGD